MSTSLEQAYAAVEQAYGEGDYRIALDMAEALLPQIQSGRDDQLQERLQLLMGHLHLYGLQQPDQAAAAYRAVLHSSQDPSYRVLAEEGLQQAGTTNTDQPATPWLDALRSSEGRALGGSEPSATAPTTPATTPRQQKAPDPYDRGLLVLSLQGRPRELDLP
ncbi:MAG: hypothetical protein ACKO2W_02580 [Vulcanococcus sp.]